MCGDLDFFVILVTASSRLTMVPSLLYQSMHEPPSHLLIPAFQSSACPPEEAQEDQLQLLQAGVGGNGLQDKGSYFLQDREFEWKGDLVWDGGVMAVRVRTHYIPI